MIKAELENTIFDYENSQNVIILPITKFVRKDGNLAVTSPITKEFAEKYKNLTKKWGYMINNGVLFPSYSTSKTNLVGVSNKNHYASAVDVEEFTGGLYYIKEQTLIKPDMIFYLLYEDFMDESKIKSIFSISDNFVLLMNKEGN